MFSRLLPESVRAMLPSDSEDGPAIVRSSAARQPLVRVNINCVGLLGLFLMGVVCGPGLARMWPALGIAEQTGWAARFVTGGELSALVALLVIAVAGIVCSLALMALVAVSPRFAFWATACAAPVFGAEYALIAAIVPSAFVSLKLGIAACVATLVFQCGHKAGAVLFFLVIALIFASDGSLVSGARPWATFALYGLFFPLLILGATMFIIEAVRERATITPEYSVPVIAMNLVLIGSLVGLVESLLRSVVRRSRQ